MKTIDLRTYRTQVQPYAPAGIMLAVILLMLVLNVAATWQPATQAPAVPTPALPAAPIVVFQQSASGARPIVVRERIVYVVATPTTAPEPVSAPAAAEAPAPTPWVADAQIVQQDGASTARIEVPTDAPRYCTGFGDWRDYDAMYQTSPACKAVQP